MMGGHAERAHALLSASGAYQWMACTPSARLQEQFPDNPSGTAAAEGTLAHELAELKVRNYFYSVDFGKRKLMAAVNKLKKEELWDDEMTGYTDDYLDYIKAVAMKYPSSPYVAIEKRVDLSTYVPEGFGTADCILIGGDVLHVIDFKYGKSPDGRVTTEWNPQMLLYALGAYEMYRILYTFKTVRLSIVQPRLSDGISEWECTLDEMLQFGEFVKERAALAIKGEGEFAPAPKTCRYCRANFNPLRPRGRRQQYYTKKPTILHHISTIKSHHTPSNHRQPTLHTSKTVLIVQFFRCESPRKFMFASGSHQTI